MSRRPFGITLLVWTFVTAPLVKLLYLSGTTRYPLEYLLEKFLELPFQSPVAWLNFTLFWIVTPLCGVLLYRFQKSSLKLFLILQSAMAATLLTHFSIGSISPLPAHFPLKIPDYAMGLKQLELFYLAMGFGTGIYFFLPKIQSVTKDSSLRWWETRKRYEMLALFRCCGVGRDRTQEQTGQILEISLYGAFIRFNNQEEIKLLPGEKITLNICENWFQLHNIEAVVVHARAKRGRSGYGVKLLPKGIWQKYQLENLISLMESSEFSPHKIRNGWSFP